MIYEKYSYNDPPPCEILIVYDMDGILWPLDKRAAEEIGADPRDFVTYHFCDNPRLSQAQILRSQEIFCDPNFFRDIKFYPGVQDILRPRELGAKVMVVSNSLNQEVAKVKLPQLLAAVPGLTEEDILLPVLDSNDDKPKQLDEKTTILVDDSPYNIRVSPAEVNLMLRAAWNVSDEALMLMRNKRVIWRNTLPEINESVYKEAKKLIMKSA